MQLSDLPGVLERCRALAGTTGGTGDMPAVEESDRELREFDELLTSTALKSQPAGSAVLWTLVIVFAASLLVVTGLWLMSLPDATLLRILTVIVGSVLIIGGVGSGAVSVVWLWAGVILGRRCRRADRAFRAGLSDIAGLTTPAGTGGQDDSPDLTQLSRTDLIDLLQRRGR